MLTVNIHEAKTQLSRLVDQAVKGEAFIIAKAGKPLVKVAGLDAPDALSASASLRERSSCQGTSIACAMRRLPASSGPRREAAPRHAGAPVG